MSGLADEAIERLRARATWPAFETDRYVVIDEIGRGGMGTVYLAQDVWLGREVAIKVSSALSSPALEQRIEREARVLARIEHPGIVPIHDVGHLLDGRLFYVMKRVRGETIAAVLGGLSLDDRLRVFERICEAVAFAHAHGCIHRDLTPENVMLGAFGEVLVMDWGVAKVEADPADAATAGAGDRGTRSDTVIGTPGYMAPEQARGGARDVDIRADVYGLGALLFTLLTGETPPVDASVAASTIASDEGQPRALRAICARALATDPADRYASATALSADVARFRSGQAVEAHPETLMDRARRVAWAYRTPIFLVLAYLVMRMVVAVTAGW